MNPNRRDHGFTLIELLVTMVLLGVVGTIIVMMVVNANRAFVRSDDESRGLGDAKNVLDQVARDIRSSREVVCDDAPNGSPPAPVLPRCATHLELWVDSDSDYAKDPDEVITWRLEPSGDGVHFNVVRTDGSGNSRVIATSLVTEALFEYCDAAALEGGNDGARCDSGQLTEPEAATLVTVTMRYDARRDAGTDERTAWTSARLRNK